MVSAGNVMGFGKHAAVFFLEAFQVDVCRWYLVVCQVACLVAGGMIFEGIAA